MKKQISTTVTEIGYFSKDWIISHYDSTEDLIKITKTKAYSNTIFADATIVSTVIILDIYSSL